MSTTETRSGAASGARVPKPDMKLEVVVVAVSDVDRAKAFYESIGWRLDADIGGGEFRLVQFTPPGSACSIQFGKGLTDSAPGAAPSLVLVVSDIEATHDQLARRGVASEVFHEARPGYGRFHADGRASGPDPERRSYTSFMTFSDPDGNGWLLQEVTSRLPGRVDATETTYSTTDDLADAMRRASVAHGEHEKRIGAADANWPAWYASYMVAEQSGVELPQ